MIIRKDKNFRYMQEVGRGRYGEVTAGVLNGRMVALKQVFQSETSYEDMLHEGEMLWRTINIKAIPDLIGFSYGRNGVEIVMEFVGSIKNGNVLCSDTVSMVSALYDDQRRRFTRAIWLNVVRDVVHGLVELHRVNLLHCDVCAANVMLQYDKVKQRWRGRIIDLGLARRKDPVFQPAHMAPKKYPRYMAICPHTAPEIAQGDPHTTASDVYSVGALLYLVNDKVNDNGVLSKLSDNCRDIDPRKRLAMEEVLAQLDEISNLNNVGRGKTKAMG